MELGDADDADEAPAFRAPPAPDDRLWRHPSELAWAPRLAPRRSSWSLAVASGLTGAVLTLGVLAAAGVLHTDRRARELVVREVARPAVAVSTSGDDDDIAAVAHDVAPAVILLQEVGGEGRVGSGVLFRSDGDAVTTAHLVDDIGVLRAVLADGRVVGAHLVAVDPESDVAVVKLDGSGPFPTALLGSADGIAVGQPAIAVSATGGAPAQAVTSGVVRATGREPGAALADMIQTDAAIPAGSSGGALLDRSGAVVGITTELGPDGRGYEGLAFAIPVDVARAVADDLLLLGHVRTVWVGVRGKDLVGGAGVVIGTLMDGSPAAAAGLRVGDVVRRVDGRPVGSMSSVRLALRRHHPGDHVTVVFDRGSVRHTADLVLLERPAA